MGDARAGDSCGCEVTGAYADTINQFAGREVTHVVKVYDTGGQLGYYADPTSPENDVPDGFLGRYKTTGGFEMNKSAFDEVKGNMWYGRLRPKAKAGGGSIE